MNVTATLFGQFLTFGVLIWFVWKFLWDPMLNMLEARKTRIADGLAAAEEGQQARARAEVEVQGHLEQAKEQAKEIIAQAHRRADEIVEGAQDDARAEGQRLLAAAQAEIEQQAQQAREQLRAEVVEIAMSGAEQVLGREVDVRAHGDALDKLAAQIQH